MKLILMRWLRDRITQNKHGKDHCARSTRCHRLSSDGQRIGQHRFPS